MPASVVSAATVSGGSSTKRKVDERIKVLIDDAAANKHRSVMVLVGDRCKEHIVNLHTMVSRAQHTSKVRVLWCMKDDPIFSSTSKKHLQKHGRLEVKHGVATEASKETFETFLAQTDIRYCQYKESHKVLGQTFGMAILQDFEALTPNVLARTIETVAGGGMILFLLHQMQSLQQLHTIAMDVHSRFRSESHGAVVPRFNERFLLSLCDCRNMLCVDDDLNVLNITNNIKNMLQRRDRSQQDDRLRLEGRLRHEAELADLKSKLSANKDVGPLVGVCQTIDQAKAVLGLARPIAEKSLRETAAITAGRGRGKSAALGLATAAALLQGYSNIFVTAPSPENVATLFEFAVRGLTECGYVERKDFQALESTNAEFAKCIVRIDVTRGHRQTVQFIAPTDSARFAQAELLIVDEAAAIPLPLVQKMLGPYLVFLSSTISGYEGTGRSLSLKLIGDMKTRQAAGTSERSLAEVSLEAPIRYGPNDPVEAWLTKLLCLDATVSVPKPRTAPHPNDCELHYVDRDALFSYHPTAEKALTRLVSLFVAAHYKNQPNDLQLLSDAPGHHLFALCGPRTSEAELPEIFAVVHVAEEGNVAADRLSTQLQHGTRPSGDLIPYTIAQHYLEKGFAGLAGMRVVRIAAHPEMQRGGYGTAALKTLLAYFRGEIATVGTMPDTPAPAEAPAGGMVAPRKTAPTLLVPLDHRPAELVDYVGVSFGLTVPLFNFWQRAGFRTLYLRQRPNDLTAEHSCIMVNSFKLSLSNLHAEFHRRFLSLLPLSFRRLPVDLALAVALDGTQTGDSAAPVAPNMKDFPVTPATAEQVAALFNAEDVRRLDLFGSTFVDTSIVLDLVPRVARLYFERRLFVTPDGTRGVTLSLGHAAMLLAVGLQGLQVDDVINMQLFKGMAPVQLRALFQKAMQQIVEYFQTLLATSSSPDEMAAATSKKDEVETERRDADGNVIGLSVKRRVETRPDTDSTLHRDTKSVARGAGSAAVTRSSSTAPKPRKFRRTGK